MGPGDREREGPGDRQQAGVGRAVAEHVLQQEGRDDEPAHVGEVGEELVHDGEGEVAAAEVRQRDQRMVGRALDQDEPHQEHHRQHEHGDDERARPAHGRASVEPHQRRAHTRAEQHRAGHVERRALVAVGLGQHEEPDDQGEQRHRHLADEDPAPAVGLDDGTTDHHADDRATGRDQRPVAEGLGPSLAREQLVDHGQRRRAGGRADARAEHPEQDERPAAPGQRGEPGEGRHARPGSAGRRAGSRRRRRACRPPAPAPRRPGSAR